MSTEDVVRLFVRCKKCGTAFDTGRVMRTDEFEKGDLKGTQHTCMHCAEPSRYTKNDYIPRSAA